MQQEQVVVNKYELYLGGNKEQQIGWVSVFSGVNVIEFMPGHETYRNNHTFLILPIGDVLHAEFYGAYDRSKHKLPY